MSLGPNPSLRHFYALDSSPELREEVRPHLSYPIGLSGRRLSELFGLKCDDKHIQISIEIVQLVPASLSKTERVGHLRLPI